MGLWSSVPKLVCVTNLEVCTNQPTHAWNIALKQGGVAADAAPKVSRLTAVVVTKL